MLIHRAREHLGAHGTLVREGTRLRLDPATPLALPDPRSTPALEERVLLFVGARPGSGARAAAGGLQLPLRSVQRTLQRLVDDGVLRSEANGRNVGYQVVDTTFSLPTRWK